MSGEQFTMNTPDLIDAVSRAARIAPKRGHEFDVAAGIRFSTEGGKLVVKASDLSTNYRQQAPLLEGDFEPFRCPSGVLANWISHLPTGEGSVTQVRLLRDEQRVTFTSETSKAKFGLIMGESFPEFKVFGGGELAEVDGLAERLRQVSWACHRDSIPLSGIHIDGDFLVGCDTAKIAEVECVVPVDRPVTAPLTGVANALRGNRGPVGIRVDDRFLYLAPDPDIQITTTLYEASYPNIQFLRDKTTENVETQVVADAMQAALARINSLCSAERYPTVTMQLDGTAMRLSASIEELGEVEELLEFEVGLNDQKIEVNFTPTTLAEIGAAANGTLLTVAWPKNLDPLQPLRITDKAGFNCIAMPRRNS